MRTAAITGTRSTGHRSPDDYAGLFADYLAPFAEGAHFYVGGAQGIDTMSLLWLAANTKALITVVVPGSVGQQPAEARQAITRCRNRIKEITELGAPELCTPAYHARNRYMVDRTGMAIGFPHHADEASGTWQTLNYASQQGKPRLIVPV
ncbi:DNA-processing protein DprA [Streptomyces boncukensis]|uniref:Smf/DprA SLOG domain-containing protein n=1 Tax=Streptomyces boncukensis TaxID=2711219 RepID=A0A6G4X4Z3_9ACTN|nr:DNA-processing protein DprA [Streptomyces boncukensis]NGO72606.1 hypothetical protein [Streptomyces boncukensis]